MTDPIFAKRYWINIRITDETSFPLCKLDHDDEEIEGRYKAGSYFIKYEQHEIEMTS